MGMMDDDDTVYCDVQMPITAPTHGAEDTSPIFMTEKPLTVIRYVGIQVKSTLDTPSWKQ